jgi:CDP-diglyceride synthetase
MPVFPETVNLPLSRALVSEAGVNLQGFGGPAFEARLPVSIQFLTIVRLALLLAVANGAPVIAAKVLGERFSCPLDGGVEFIDGRPLFGKSKTVRGIVISILLSTLAAPLLGLDWWIGAAVGSAAMAGDLVSSFVKRRLNLAPSSRATGLDQIPESLLPLLACRSALALSILDMAAGVAIFFVGEVILSLLLYKAHIRDRPY